MKRLTCAAILAFLFSPMPSDAQIVTGTIIGTVTDESRAVLPGVDRHADVSRAAGRTGDDSDR